MNNTRAFTIIELVVVIAVIGLLATVGVVAWNSHQQSVHQDILRSDLTMAAAQLSNELTWNDAYPETEALVNEGQGLPKSEGTSYTYNRIAANSYCLSAHSSRSGVTPLHITSDGSIAEGDCSESIPGTGSPIQTVTAQNCPTTRIRVVDARDNKTYWVQKMDDGKCWMLTNLAYSGGGSNDYDDVKSLTAGTATTSTAPHYYIPPGANPTSGTTDPSTSTSGTGQYGYLYNFCAANGGQSGNGACSGTSSAPVDTSTSICPSGWRLPSSDGFAQLANSMNADPGGPGSGETSLLPTALQENWLAQRGGEYSTTGSNHMFISQGSVGHYWSSSQASSANGRALYFRPNAVRTGDPYSKTNGFSVRCIAI